MMNLLKETNKILNENRKKLDEAVWIGSQDGYISLETFKKLSDVEYDNGFGGQMVPFDLVIIGKDWFLTRKEYDGSEWWEYISMEMFQKPKNELIVKTLVDGSWSSLIDMSGEKETW